MIKPMQHNGLYKSENLLNWKMSTEYWLSSPLRHVVDNDHFIDKILEDSIEDDMTVIDMGCGDAFLYLKIREKWPRAKYIGLDFNEPFIRHLKTEYSNDDHAIFMLIDFEKELPSELYESAEIVFNFFNILEIENLAKVFENAVNMLKAGGTFSILTIEYTYLILAISKDINELKYNLKRYEEIRSEGNIPYTFQKIDLGDSESDTLSYGSVFHSTTDIISEALKCKFEILEFSENIKTSKFHPKVYQYIELKKN